jgi:hypothetical protein
VRRGPRTRSGLRLACPTALAATVLAVCAPPAFAYWSATGSGAGEAYVTTLLTPALTVTPAPEAAQLRWSEVNPPAGLAAEVSYYVTRNGGAPGPGCPSKAAPSHVLSCTDPGLAAGSTYTYTVVAIWRSWQGMSEAHSVTIASTTVTHFQLEAASATVAAGEPDALTILAKDASGNTVKSFTGSHPLTFEGASPATTGTAPTVASETGAAVALGQQTAISFSEGRATVSGQANGLMRLYRAEVAHIVVKEGSLTSGAGLPITVTAGPFKSFGVTPAPAAPQAGAAFEVRLVAWDEWHNAISSYARTAPLRYEGAESAPGGKSPEYSTETTPTFAAGEAVVRGFKLYKAATTTLRVREEGSEHAGTATFTVTPGAPATLMLAAAAAEVGAGQADPLSLTALDAWGNTATSYGGASGELKSLLFEGASPSPNGSAPTVTSATGSAVRFGEATAIRFTNGTATVSGQGNGLMTLYRVETAHIRVREGALGNGAGLAITVRPGEARSFSVSAPVPGEPEAGQQVGLTLTALDAGGNIATSFGGARGEAKVIAYSGPEAAPSGQAPAYPASATTVTFREGSGTASGIVLYRAAPTTLTASAGAITGSIAFTVIAGPAARMAWTEARVSAGTIVPPCALECLVEGLGSLGTFSARVSIADEWGNPQTSHRGAIEVTLGARRMRGTAGGTLSSTSLTIPAGSATSQPFTFTAPQLQTGEEEGGGRRFRRRRRRKSFYEYRLDARARGFARSAAATATLRS